MLNLELYKLNHKLNLVDIEIKDIVNSLSDEQKSGRGVSDIGEILQRYDNLIYIQEEILGNIVTCVQRYVITTISYVFVITLLYCIYKLHYLG